MKTNTFTNIPVHHSTPRIMTLGLALAGLTCFAADPANSADKEPSNSTDSMSNWEDQVASQMQHMQQEMDSLFRDSVKGIDAADKSFTGPKFDASASVQDRGDSYVATFYLPKRDLSNVKVSVKEGILSVNASSEQTTKSNDTANGNNSSETEMLNDYEQLVTLPGPVDSAKMKVDKQGDSLRITLPKKDGKRVSDK